MYSYIERLLLVAQKKLMLLTDDVEHIRNVLYSYFNLAHKDLNNVNDVVEDMSHIIRDMEKHYQEEHKNSFDKDFVLDLLTPLPSVVQNEFQRRMQNSSYFALSFLKDLSLNNGTIIFTAELDDTWIDYDNQFKSKYILETEMELLQGLNTRKGMIELERNTAYLSFNRSQCLDNEIIVDFKIDLNDRKMFLNDIYSLLEKIPDYFLYFDENKLKGALANIAFFERKCLSTIPTSFFKTGTIEICDSEHTFIKLSSPNKDEICDMAMYFENTWQAYSNDMNNYIPEYYSMEEGKYICYLLLMNKKIDFKDFLFTRNVMNHSLAFIGQTILNCALTKDISRLANILSDRTFDIEWYMASNPELQKYLTFINSLIDKNGRDMDKNVAISIIEKEISKCINNDLLQYVAYTHDELGLLEMHRYLDILGL